MQHFCDVMLFSRQVDHGSGIHARAGSPSPFLRQSGACVCPDLREGLPGVPGLGVNPGVLPPAASPHRSCVDRGGSHPCSSPAGNRLPSATPVLQILCPRCAVESRAPRSSLSEIVGVTKRK
eukprot:CAMPEP_0181302732 /NCGR_PEP_ID=MMETSP1101-20121128/8161_1 /TAXON_ID=46948 /ORGANISM="Rhodomonas abbreviata, Strain Caron Lab Isolate" /LENGTH=121 /DNA_ID=CAMNT_0023408217 /DNA_START=1226 /DNA_END=1591 /DNA_ORIENTATION=+